jgi:hypothetical protein
MRSWVFAGNTVDVTTVARIKDDLRGWKLGRAIFVTDAGMNSEDNRLELARGAGKYVLAMPVGAVAEVKEAVLSRPRMNSPRNAGMCSKNSIFQRLNPFWRSTP